MLQVVASVMCRNGRVLVGQRRADQRHPLQWEFPGGKVEPGETLLAALQRELEEETGITGVRAREATRYVYAYPGRGEFELIFFHVTAWEGEPRNLIFEELRWEETGRLRSLNFVEGDRAFLETLPLSATAS